MKNNYKDLLTYLEFAKNTSLKPSKTTLFSIIYRFKEAYPIVHLCKLLNVSKSGYYKWLNNNDKEDPDLIFKKSIEKIQSMSDFTIGYRRMKFYIEKDLGITINHKKVYRIMKKYNLLSHTPASKKYKIMKKATKPFNNLINGNFTASMPNEKWCTDITTIKTLEGNLHLSAIEDMYDRFIISYKTSSFQNFTLVKKTIEDATKQVRSSHPIILHSDQGSTYKNKRYKQITSASNIKPSMSKKATPTDNAVIESFFSTLKKECIHRYIFQTKKEAKLAIDNYIFFYNYYRIRLNTKRTPYEARSRALNDFSPLKVDSLCS